MTAPATDSLSGIVEIVAGLTMSERLFVCGGSPDDLQAGGYALGRKGLAQLDNHVTPHRFYLTPLGIAIRQHMEKES